MTAQNSNAGRHQLSIHGRTCLTATGVERIAFFSDEMITADTAAGKLQIKGSGLYIENLSADTGELLVKGQVQALRYVENEKSGSVVRRLFR